MCIRDRLNPSELLLNKNKIIVKNVFSSDTIERVSVWIREYKKPATAIFDQYDRSTIAFIPSLELIQQRILSAYYKTAGQFEHDYMLAVGYCNICKDKKFKVLFDSFKKVIDGECMRRSTRSISRISNKPDYVHEQLVEIVNGNIIIDMDLLKPKESKTRRGSKKLH